MKRLQTSCDQCGKIYANDQTIIQLRKLGFMPYPQIERSDALGGRNEYCLFEYDFCDEKCLSDWLESRKS
jgi:hypothetical protein